MEFRSGHKVGRRRRDKQNADKEENLVMAAGNEHCQDHQLGIGEQPALGLLPGALRGFHDGSQVLAASEVMQMFQANSREPGDLVIGEQLLTRFDGDHIDSTTMIVSLQRNEQ